VTDPFDARASPRLVAAYPGIRTVFDPDAMAGVLAAALGVGVRTCEPGEALLEADGYCLVRQRLEVDGSADRLVVSVRLFGDGAAAVAFVDGPLSRPVDDLERRVHRPAAPVVAAAVPALAMACSIFPVDGELPALVAATDPTTVAGLLRGHVSGVDHGIRVGVAHYARRRRCALRYDAGAPPSVAYAKVANDGGGGDTAVVTDALRARPVSFAVPPVLAVDRDLGLVVLGGIAGAPFVAPLLKGRIRALPMPAGAPALEAAVRACGRVAAGLHAVPVDLARTRTLADELAVLHELLGMVRRYSPALADRLAAAVVQIEAAASATPPLPFVTAHGDFSYTQLLFDGDRVGLVDFDGVCRAEPALDLGHFLAYLRFAVVKAAGKHAVDHADLEHGLAAAFLDSYRDAVGGAGGRDELDARVATYEAVSLLRLAIHAWQKLKPTRLDRILDVLDRRLGRVPA
jgi:aminoglycoside phosphotransferase (APT) family kinase protein